MDALNADDSAVSMFVSFMEIAAGGGIVADSDPERELAETRAKAKGLLLALAQESA